MPDVFSTENLSFHCKIIIGLKEQFDLHKLLYFFMKIRPVFLLVFFDEGCKNSYFDD